MLFSKLLKIFTKQRVLSSLNNAIEIYYRYPTHQCGSTILICGPSYGDKKYFGSFIVEASQLAEWAFKHSKSVWSSNKDEQKAREYLPLWLSIGNKDRESYISLLDLPMRHVLVPYLYDFYLNGWVTIYCHQCHAHHHKLIENNHDNHQDGLTSKWVREWLCANGHIVHHQHFELRWISRK